MLVWQLHVVCNVMELSLCYRVPDNANLNVTMMTHLLLWVVLWWQECYYGNLDDTMITWLLLWVLPW